MQILPGTRAALATAYNWHQDTLRKKLRALGITHRGALTPMDLELIFTKIGHPDKFKELQKKFG